MMTGLPRSIVVGLAAAVSLALATPIHAQQHEPEHETTAETVRDMVAPSSQHEATGNQIDIAHHIGNSHQIETPFGIVHLPDNWKIPLGTDSHGQPRYLDLSPTRHLVYMLLAAVIVSLVFIFSARTVARRQTQGRP